MPIGAVVADANVLLSAVVGKAALRVFTDFGVTVHVATFNADEVAEYLPHMAAKYRLPAELVEVQWRLLPLELHSQPVYEGFLGKAQDKLAARDPEDAHALALAWALRMPLWTNDRDFDGLAIECFSTARLLATLEREGKAR